MSNLYRIKDSVFERSTTETIEEYPLIILSMEGTVTEKEYFCGLRDAINNRSYRGRAVFKLLPLEKIDTNSDPSSVIDLLDEYINRKLKGHFGAIYAAVIDKDSHPLAPSIFRCKEKNYQLFATNPCFEFFLLMHLDDSLSSRTDLDKILENNKESVQHTYTSKIVSELTHKAKSVDFNDYKDRIDICCLNSIHFENNIHKLNDKLGSNLPLLFEIISGVRTTIWDILESD